MNTNRSKYLAMVYEVKTSNWKSGEVLNQKNFEDSQEAFEWLKTEKNKHLPSKKSVFIASALYELRYESLS